MPSPDVRQASRSQHPLTRVAVILSIVAITLSVYAIARFPKQQATPVHSESTLDRIKRTHVIRAGYGNFPPYTILNINQPDSTKRVTGFCVDLMDEIAKRCDPPLTVEWEPFNWQTMRGELDQGRVDVLADIVYATVPRALDMGLTRPFSYVGIACGLVRADETRIKTFQDLENKDITIALAVGWASSEYAFVNLSRPRNDYLMIPAGNDASPQLDAVLNGRADIALNDVPSVVQYVGNHRGRVKALWVDSPPSLVAGAFATRQGDVELLIFLNEAIQVLQVDGTIQTLDKKWKTLGHFERPELTPGAGLQRQ